VTNNIIFEQYGLLGSNDMQFGDKPTFRRDILPLSSGPSQARNKQKKAASYGQGKSSLPSASVNFLFGSLLTLNMGAICSFEISGCFRTAWCYGPEDCTRHSHRRENLKSNNINFLPLIPLKSITPNIGCQVTEVIFHSIGTPEERDRQGKCVRIRH
jgi:hypothetical protein